MRLYFVIFLAALSFTVLATESTGPRPDPVERTLHTLAPGATVDSLTRGPFPGVVTAVVDGQPLYISDDGRYVLQGHLYDMRAGMDLSTQHQNASRARILSHLEQHDLIVFSPQHPRYRVIAFLDPTCGYCQQLVANMEGYLAEGIEVDVAAWPRAGTTPESPGYQQAVDIWCAPNRMASLKATFAGRPLPLRQCANPVSRQASVAVALGLPGTPGVLTPDGALLGGFVPPAQLRARLDQHQAHEADTRDGSQ